MSDLTNWQGSKLSMKSGYILFDDISPLSFLFSQAVWRLLMKQTIIIVSWYLLSIGVRLRLKLSELSVHMMQNHSITDTVSLLELKGAHKYSSKVALLSMERLSLTLFKEPFFCCQLSSSSLIFM